MLDNSNVDSPLEFEPEITLSVPTGDFLTESLDVTVSIRGVDHAVYQIDGGEAVAFENGDVITVGAELGNNGTVTVTLTGYDEAGNVVAEASATYTKKIYKGNATIYVDPAVKPEWEEMAVYIYGAPGDNGGWPGHTFTEADMVNGLYVYQLPEAFQGTTATVIFNNNNNGVQVEKGWQIGPDQQKIWRASESSADGVWEDFVIETNIYVSADFVAAQNWDAVSAHIYNLNNVTTSWPGIAGVLQEEGQWTGYYKMAVPADPFEDLNDLRVILNNAGAGSQLDVGDGGDIDLAWGQTKVMTAGGLWMDGYLLSASNVYTLPEGGTDFYGETLEVKLFADNVVTATYQIGAEGEKTEYVTGDVITVGAGLADNETVTVYLEGVNAAGKTVTAEADFTKHFVEGQESVSVLFIGNSYTFYNDGVWTHFQKLAYEAGYNVTVDQVTIGSHRLYQFADPNESDPAGGPVVEQKLSENVYDYVFLQEQSTAPVDQYAQFESGVVTLSERIKRHNEDAVVILYQTWGRESGSADLTGRGWTNETMTYDLAYGYEKAADLVGAIVSPAGIAFHEVYSKHAPAIDLYDADQTHPTLTGTYLASLVHIGTVFGPEAVANAVGYTAGLKASTIEVLKQAALDAPALNEQAHLYITPVATDKPMNGDVITLTLNAIHVAEAVYQLDGGEEIPFTYGQKIRVEGDVLADGQVTVTLKAVAEDITARSAELGFAAFTSAGMDSSSDWRFKTHLANLPIYFEYQADGISTTTELKGSFLDNYRMIWDLYINNSTCAPAELSAKTGDDSRNEFLNGEAVFFQNGSWEYNNLKAVYSDDELVMIPIYVGTGDEANQGLCTGCENFWCVNKDASQEDIEATLTFLNWCITEGAEALANDMGFVIPFDTAVESPNLFVKQDTAYTAAGKNPVSWTFTTMPSEEWKNMVGSALTAYAADPTDANWALVVEAFVDGWASEYAMIG